MLISVESDYKECWSRSTERTEMLTGDVFSNFWSIIDGHFISAEFVNKKLATIQTERENSALVY